MGQPLNADQAYLYGQFVLAAYAMFDNPQGGDPLRPDPAGLPRGYELEAWVQMSDFILNAEEPEFYGIVVHDAANPDSRIIAIRGTEGVIEWVDDAYAILVPFRQVPTAGCVAKGFDRIYGSLKVVPNKAPRAVGAAPEIYTGSFGDQLEQLATSRERARGLTPSTKRPPRPTVIVGHSLGAALATLFVMENDSKGKFDIVTSCTFASPRVGNVEFASRFDRLTINSWRVVNTCDLVPKLPPHIPVVLDYAHVDVGYSFASSAFAKHNLTCAHAMETYLHWLQSTFPLRPACLP